MTHRLGSASLFDNAATEVGCREVAVINATPRDSRGNDREAA